MFKNDTTYFLWSKYVSNRRKFLLLNQNAGKTNVSLFFVLRNAACNFVITRMVRLFFYDPIRALRDDFQVFFSFFKHKTVMDFTVRFLGTSNIETTVYVFYVTRTPRERRNNRIAYGTTYFRLVNYVRKPTIPPNRILFNKTKRIQVSNSEESIKPFTYGIETLKSNTMTSIS